MKRSEMTVTMPISSYEELVNFKNKYVSLVESLYGCFNFEHFETKNIIEFKVNECLGICESCLPNRFRTANIIKTE